MPYLLDIVSVVMKPTPGQVLAAELKSRKISKSAFGKLVGRHYQTINFWTKDKGFEKEQRELAASKLGLPSTHFDNPSLAEQRETYRLDLLAEFRSHPMTPPLTSGEWYSVESIRFPPDRLPSVAWYEGYVHHLRGNITRKQFESNVGPNAEADAANAKDALAKSGGRSKAKSKQPGTRRRHTHK